MDRETQIANEFQALRALGDEDIPRVERHRIVESLSRHTFIEPEHQVVFQSMLAIFSRGPITVEQLRVHLNNRGFPDTDVEKYFQSETAANSIEMPSNPILEQITAERSFSKTLAILFVSIAAILVALLFYGGVLRRLVRESLMQRVISTHYEILYPRGALSQDAITKFEAQREPLFAALDKKLGDAVPNSTIRVVFDPDFSAASFDDTVQQSYSVTGMTIRTKLNRTSPRLPAAADAEALLHAAWGEPGNAQIARWTAYWLLGEWRGLEIGMAAAQVEQRLGHKKLASVLADPGGEIASPDDRTLLGAAWISEVAEFGGATAVRKIYTAKMSHPSVDQATKVLGTSSLELDRKWQMWIYAYVAGMPSMSSDPGMPMDMPMAGGR